MSFKKSLLGLFLIFFLAQVATAQMPGIPAPGKMPKMFGEFKMPEVGSYAEYKLSYPDRKVEVMARMSIVGKEKTPEGKELFWYEYQTKDLKTENIDIVKMLISGDPQKDETITRMILKHNQDKAMELPAEMMQMINAPMKKEKEKAEEKGEVIKLGKETLKTQAGNLECTHLRYLSGPMDPKSEKKETSDIWQTPEIPFYGLAKSVTKGMRMDIQKFGKDAKSAITEEPEEFTIPGMEKKEVPKSSQPPK